MSSAKYEIVSQADDEIAVRDTATGHVFTFTVKPSRLVGRLLSEAKYVTSENSKVRPEDVVRFVWNFAQMQMKQEGKIDRVIVW